MIWKIFCKHEYKNKYLNDYANLTGPSSYVLTICQKCGKIKHGSWMTSDFSWKEESDFGYSESLIETMKKYG